ncbi:MAG: hypothetical protein EG828_08785 [Deltaproteobacteria bacterium]|nr:hypothetical protein [Deltaproteobacteria bacterium]
MKYKENIYDGQHEAMISEELFNSVQEILRVNNVTKTAYRQPDDRSFYLKGLVRCGACRSAMAPSYAYSKGKKYFYYRCNVDNDQSKNKCRIGSVPARKLEDLVVNELKFLSEDPRIIEGVVENATNATKDQREKVKELTAKKRILQDNQAQVNKKSRNLLEVLSEAGSKSNASSLILKELDELELQGRQLKTEIETIEFEANDLENKIVSADIIRENFKVFKDVYDHLTTNVKYDLLHLLVKKVVYFEEKEKDNDAKIFGGK